MSEPLNDYDRMLAGYGDDFKPTTEGTQITGTFVFHDGHWWYAGRSEAVRDDEPVYWDAIEEACPDCGGQRWIVGVTEGCCGNVLPSGECCAAKYGTANLVPEQTQEPCPNPLHLAIADERARLIAALPDEPVGP